MGPLKFHTYLKRLIQKIEQRVEYLQRQKGARKHQQEIQTLKLKAEVARKMLEEGME